MPDWLENWSSSLGEQLEIDGDSPSENETPPEPSPGRELPPTKLTLVMVDGQPTEVELELFQHPEFPLTLYTPRGEFSRLFETIGDTQSVQFNLIQDDGEPDPSSYLQLVVPVHNVTLDELRNRVLGDNGILASRRWQMVDRTRVLTYTWADERIDFQHTVGDTIYRGSLFLGDRDGQPFYALTYYPQALAPSITPRLSMILDTIDRRDI
ncbi:MAG: hypothetical protein EA367_07870 [Leptolyngbya sp. DLM2.Bin15]|nr:MAG: hypothetical protein EA367_07870 [Leptolyngbya sp. DLM2.Bin15]